MSFWTQGRIARRLLVTRRTSSRQSLRKTITPTSPGAEAILAKFGYAMNRALVTENEPADTERRRALMQSFMPEDLAPQAPMLCRLTRELVDRPNLRNRHLVL